MRDDDIIRERLARRREAQLGGAEPARLMDQPPAPPPMGTPPVASPPDWQNHIQPVGAPEKLTTPQGPQTGTMPPGGSQNAFAQYGTGNIPGAENLTWGDTSRLKGYNTNAWGGQQPGYDEYTIKNSAGKVFSRYADKPSSIPMVLADPDFQRLFPGAKQVGFDKIDFGDGNPIDVLENADPNADTSSGWQWGAPDGSGGGAAGAGGAAVGGAPFGIGLGSILSGQDPMADILKRIEDLNSGRTPAAEREALMAMLTRGAA